MPVSTYRELPPRPQLAGLLACTWSQHVSRPHRQRIVPDGCVDLIWLADRELVVAGPATGPARSDLPAGSTTVGVRWRPGAGAPALGLPLDALLDVTVPLSELWGRDAADALAERVAGAPPGARAELLQDVVAARAAAGEPVDRLVTAACRVAAWDALAGRTLGVRALADGLGVSERQLLRRFRAAVGYGPRTLARVLRFQRFLAGIWEPSGATAEGVELGRLAADAGYADQSHLVRDCRRLAGVTPSQLLAGG